MRSIYFTIISILLLGGCSSKVGGECKYGERIVGNATIKSIDKGECIVDFRPSNRVWAEWSVKPRFKDMGALCYVNDRNIGKTYMAIYEKELVGTCSPYRVIVYDEDFLKSHPNLSKEYNLK